MPGERWSTPHCSQWTRESNDTVAAPGEEDPCLTEIAWDRYDGSRKTHPPEAMGTPHAVVVVAVVAWSAPTTVRAVPSLFRPRGEGARSVGYETEATTALPAKSAGASIYGNNCLVTSILLLPPPPFQQRSPALPGYHDAEPSELEGEEGEGDPPWRGMGPRKFRQPTWRRGRKFRRGRVDRGASKLPSPVPDGLCGGIGDGQAPAAAAGWPSLGSKPWHHGGAGSLSSSEPGQGLTLLGGARLSL
jgi:hypothetical protein